jgi:hypothetical protein
VNGLDCYDGPGGEERLARDEATMRAVAAVRKAQGRKHTAKSLPMFTVPVEEVEDPEVVRLRRYEEIMGKRT